MPNYNKNYAKNNYIQHRATNRYLLIENFFNFTNSNFESCCVISKLVVVKFGHRLTVPEVT